MTAPRPSIPPSDGFDRDVIVIGAGPAGAVLARQVAQSGLSVLLVDAKRFPRDKVCGGCLNARAVSILSAVGLEHVLAEIGAAPIEHVDFISGARCLSVPLQGGWCFRRRDFDQALVQCAIAAGVEFQSGTVATLLPEQAPSDPNFRQVRLQLDGESINLKARCVVISDGLNRRSLDETSDEFPTRISPYAWRGFSVTTPVGSQYAVPGALRMILTSSGYVGLASCESDQMNIAAAMSLKLVRRHKNPGLAATEILQSAGIQLDCDLSQVDWQGTGPLTRRSLTAAHRRVFLIGDSAGYVEPLTGEGMTWAIQSAVDAAPLVARAVQDWSDSLADEWTARLNRSIRRRQLTCHLLTTAVRSRWLTAACLSVASFLPVAPQLIASHLNRPAKTLTNCPI
ncbi:NAD(P)/FAD-dependent oxidoreductase [Planctomicrobium piriforme]|uniref:Dehydrogenase (Flavoprotein) n=1 Tax=Planctomicrobium piriforme TaxID=1576369 RepID=A0A1I3MMV4_9PLAN|nr:NAD(P)/FAD-dependent oxidoreductase [Planctomicrobium piriforme]SFI98299.1 Dehydrogenase (flavoprotein) [Planctomicrobium piriforme]